VPCRDGISLNEADYSSKEQCAAGGRVLLQAVLNYDRRLAERYGKYDDFRVAARPAETRSAKAESGTRGGIVRPWSMIAGHGNKLRSFPRPASARCASFSAPAVRRSAEREGGKREPSLGHKLLGPRFRGDERVMQSRTNLL
jgi:hypothetical protein